MLQCIYTINIDIQTPHYIYGYYPMCEMYTYKSILSNQVSSISKALLKGSKWYLWIQTRPFKPRGRFRASYLVHIHNSVD